MKPKYFITLLFISFILISPIFSETKILKVGYITNSDGFMHGKSAEDPKSGYGYDYLMEISKYTDWKYEYVYGDWPELYNMLLDGRLDILPEVSYSETREQQMCFPKYSMGSESSYIYVLDGRTSISPFDEKTLNNKTIGTLKSTVYIEYLEDWLEQHELNSTIVSFDKQEELQSALAKGKIDSIIEVDINNTKNWIPVFKIGTADFYLALSKKNQALLDELNETLSLIYQINPYFNNDLHNRYFSQTDSLKVLKSQEEEYFKNNKTIKVGCLKDYMPFSAMDISTGNITGLLPVLLNQILEIYDLQDDISLEYYFYDSVYDGFLALDSNQIDMLFPTNSSNWDAEMYNYYMTNPVSYASEKLIYKGIYSKNNLSVIGVIKGSPEYYYATNILHDSKFVLYDSYSELLDAVIQEKVNSALVNVYQDQLFFTGVKSYKSLKSIELPNNCYYSAMFGKNNKILFHFISRGLNMIDQGFIDSSVIFYAAKTLQYTLIDFVNDYLSYICFFFIGFIILIVMLVYAMEKLHNYADFDALTHLKNEKSLKPALKDAVNHAIETEGCFCIMIAEIVNFQFYINTYGNKCGDEILKFVASYFLRGVKKDDIVFRYKENKILVILNNKASVVESVVQRITKEIESDPLNYKENEIHIKIEVGVSAYAEGATSKFMLEEAEMKLS